MTRRVVTGVDANGKSVFVNDAELDDGAITHLCAGDFVIQNGTRHAWRNRSAAPTTMAFVLVGAHLD